MRDLTNKVDNGGINNDGKLPATEFVELATEVQEAIIASGASEDSANLEQLAQSIVRMAQGWGNWGTVSGSANAIVLTSLVTTLTQPSIFDGMTVKFRPSNNNTISNPTINVYGSGVITILNEQGGGLVANDIASTRDCELRYDGTNWRLLDRTKNPLQADIYKRGYIAGFYLFDIGDGDQITVGAGSASNSSFDYNLDILTNTNKNIKSNWGLGAAGGKPSAVTLANDTWYTVFAIGGDGATTDCGIDSSAAAVNLLSTASTVSGNTYNKYRKVGQIYIDSTGDIKRFYTNPGNYAEVFWHEYADDVNITDPPDDVSTDFTVTAPPGAEVTLFVDMQYATASNNREWVLDVRGGLMADIQPTVEQCLVHVIDNSGNVVSNVPVRTYVDSNSIASYRLRRLDGGNNTSLDFIIKCTGYVFNRSE